MEKPKNTFELLCKPIRRLVEQRGFIEPTVPQEETIPKILEGKNILLISPTATGKTEAAVLPILDMLVRMPERRIGIRILYITPLRALNRDILDRLQWWCNSLDVNLAVRHGDTETLERLKQARSPPEMLITTPETLQAIIPGRVMRQHLQQLKWVIIDEVHEMAESKRGSQLSLGLERLRWIVGENLQLVGLSATIGSPEKVAQFLVGSGRPVEIVKVPVARLINLRIFFPKPNLEDTDLASSLFTYPEVAARLRLIRQYVEGRKSVLIFTNTRAISEVLASRFKIWDTDLPISIHHGSLAKPSRIAAERGLKIGEVKGLICTSSLELGIDIGSIDLVIQYMSPRQVTRLIQRVGRSGHRIGKTAEGIIITMDSDDTLEAMAIASRVYKEELEPVHIPKKPYDVLAHQMAGLLMKKKRWHFCEIFELFKNAYPYAEVNLEDIQKVLAYMHSRYPRLAWISSEDMIAIKPRQTKALFRYYFENLSMIPEEKQYLVVDDSTDAAVGVLDESFMAEYGKTGIKFIIRGSPWRIVDVQSDKVYVKPVDDPSGAIPSWIGEEIPVPFEVAQEVGRIRGFVEEKMKRSKPLEEIANQLTENYPAEKHTIERALLETVEQIRQKCAVPTDKRILLEDWEDFVIISASFGSLTNRTLAQIIGQLLSEQIGHSVVVQHDPYRIFIQTTGDVHADTIMTLFDEIKRMPETAIHNTLVKAIVKTGIFKRRMIHVARRFGAIKKWADFNSVSLQKLIKSFEDTTVFDETLKEAFAKDLDLSNAILVLTGIRNGKITTKKLGSRGSITPVSRVGIERASMKTDLIPSERMQLILVESARARLLNETRTFICTNCRNFAEMIPLKELPDKPECPKCGSSALGVLSREEEEVQSLVDKNSKRLTKLEQKLFDRALRNSQLISLYGKTAAVALSGRRLKTSDAKDILIKESKLTNHFFELLIEAERKALKRRFL